MKKFLAKFKTGTSIAAVGRRPVRRYGYRKLQALAADPAGEKELRARRWAGPSRAESI